MTLTKLCSMKKNYWPPYFIFSALYAAQDLNIYTEAMP